MSEPTFPGSDGARPETEEVVLPVLLRHARYTYRDAIHRALAAAGCDDMPPNGTYIVGGIARTGFPLAELVPQLGVSKQAASQLVDTLVLRGYLERSVDPDDRRRMTVSLSPRGELAAATSRGVVERIEEELLEQVGPDAVAKTCETLIALMKIGARERGEASAD
jgi:DNA-binding MarR family transcriptional regulator